MNATRRSLPGRCGVVTLAVMLAAGPAFAQAPVDARSPGASVPGSAATPTTRPVVGVLPLEVRGKLAEHVPRALEDRLATGLVRGGFTVVTAADLRARIGPGPCDLDCQRAAAVAAGATHLVRPLVTVEGRDYNLELELLQADSGEPQAALHEVCEICGHDELGERIDDLAAAVRRKLAAAIEPPPRLRVRSRPDGSVVTIDGEVVGITPLDILVAAGEHDVLIQKQGFIAERRRLAFVDGVVETIAAELDAVPVEPPVTPTRRSRAPFGWAAIAVGLGATASGVALVALDERPIRSDCSGANIDAEGDCKWRHNTLAGGIALTITGVAAIAVGAVIVALERRRGRPSAQTTAWVSGPGFGVRF